MAQELAPPDETGIAHDATATGPESRGGILPKRGQMSKRKLHECMLRAPHSIHSFSTAQEFCFTERKNANNAIVRMFFARFANARARIQQMQSQCPCGNLSRAPKRFCRRAIFLRVLICEQEIARCVN
jgi:hypothetical protein